MVGQVKRAKTLRERQAEYEETASHLRRQIERLDADDPESADAARIWAAEARHADNMADECWRWAQKERA